MRTLAIVSLIGAAAGLAAQPAQPDLSQALRVSGVAQVVKWFATDFDAALTNLAARGGCAPATETKVVPVLDSGTGQAYGGAQVTGSREALSEARAVRATSSGDSVDFVIVNGTGSESRPVGSDVVLCGLITFDAPQ